MDLVRKIRNRLKSFRSEFWVYFLIACLLAFTLEEIAGRIVNADKNGESVLSESIFDVSGIYQQLVTTGPRKPIAHYTVLVEINPKKDPLSVDMFTGLCQQRAFLAKLLGVVASAHPAVVVLDKYFDTARCTANDEDRRLSGMLVDAWTAASQQFPVISGQAGTEVSTIPPPTGFYPRPEHSFFRLGILDLDRDNRRLPLRWILPPEFHALAARTDGGGTLALEAAQQYDPRILSKNQRMQGMVNRGENSYISFLKPEQFTHFYAGELLCMAPSNEIADQCAQLKPQVPSTETSSLRDLNHQIVVIGERSEREDNYNSIVGPVPGFYLWANYIEAALDDRMFRPVHPLINYCLGFFIFAFFEHILQRNHDNPWRAVGEIVVLLILTLLVLYLAVVHFGYYLNPATVGLLAIAINLGHLAFTWVEKRERGHS